MDFIERINELMKIKGLNKHQLAKESGIPYSTIDNFYKIGFENVKLSTLKKLSAYFETSLDYLVGDDLLSDIDESSFTLISLFKELNNEGREKVLDYTNDLSISGKYKKGLSALNGGDAAINE